MGLVSRGYRVLREEGTGPFVRKASEFVLERLYWEVFGRLYWTVRHHYRLSIGDTTVTFSAPNHTVVKRNHSRFRSEREELTALLRELRDDDVVWDVGANTGLYTLFAADRCSRVLAFEPYPPNRTLLERDVARNEASNVEVFDLALSDANGHTTFRQPEADDVGFGSASIVPEADETTIDVPTRAGDALVSEEGVPVPDVVKIDVEGSEPLVLDGLQRTLSDPACRLVYCEVHLGESDEHPSIHDFDSDLSDIEDRLRACGFGVRERQTRGWELFLEGRK